MAKDWKKGKRLTEAQRSAMAHDIKLNILSDEEIGKSYGVSRQNVSAARKRMKSKEAARPLSVMEMKKALDVAKAESMLVYVMEIAEYHLARLNKPKDDVLYNPMTVLDTVGRISNSILQIRNALAFSTMPQGGEEEMARVDAVLIDQMVSAMPEEQRANALMILTGGKPIVPKPTNPAPDSGKAAEGALQPA
jgi:hypothetical protein